MGRAANEAAAMSASRLEVPVGTEEELDLMRRSLPTVRREAGSDLGLEAECSNRAPARPALEHRESATDEAPDADSQ